MEADGRVGEVAGCLAPTAGRPARSISSVRRKRELARGMQMERACGELKRHGPRYMYNCISL